jgi:hypothetical protein
MYLTIAIFALGILYLAAWRGVLKKLLIWVAGLGGLTATALLGAYLYHEHKPSQAVYLVSAENLALPPGHTDAKHPSKYTVSSFDCRWRSGHALACVMDGVVELPAGLGDKPWEKYQQEQLRQDKEFQSAPPDQQTRYLSSIDPDFAKASPADQSEYLSRVLGWQDLNVVTLYDCPSRKSKLTECTIVGESQWDFVPDDPPVGQKRAFNSAVTFEHVPKPSGVLLYRVN